MQITIDEEKLIYMNYFLGEVKSINLQFSYVSGYGREKLVSHTCICNIYNYDGMLLEFQEIFWEGQTNFPSLELSRSPLMPRDYVDLWRRKLFLSHTYIATYIIDGILEIPKGIILQEGGGTKPISRCGTI